MEDISSTVGNECPPYKHQNDYKQIVMFYKSKISAKLTKTPLSARHMNVPQIVSWPEKIGKSEKLLEFPFFGVDAAIHCKA